RRSTLGGHRNLCHGNVDRESRPNPGLGDHVDVSAASRNNPVHTRKSEPGPALLALRREVRLEDLVAHVSLHAVPSVGYRNLRVCSRSDARMLERVFVAELDLLDLDLQTASIRHGVSCIDGEVRDQLIQLPRIDEHMCLGLEPSYEDDVRAEQSAEDRKQSVDSSAHTNDFRVTKLPLGDV